MRLGQTSVIVFLSKIIGSVFGFLATLYFARFLGAGILGYYSITVALISWIKLGSNLGISTAVAKRISEGRDPSEHLAGGVLLAMTFAFVLSMLILLFGDRINTYVGRNVYLFVLFLSLSGLFLSFVSSVLKGENKVHLMGILTPLNIGISSLAQIILVFFGMELMGMFIGYLIGEIVVTTIGASLVSITLAPPTREHIESLYKYARYAWLNGIESQSFNDVDTFILGALVSPSLVGVYSVAWSLSQFLSLFGRSVRATLFPEISRFEAEGNEEQIAKLTRKSLAYIGIVAIPGFFGSLIVGDRLMRIYGPEFEQGDVVISLLILAVLIYSYQQQLTGILSGIDRPDVTFRVNVTFIATNLVLNVVLVMWRGWVGAAIASVTSTVVGTLIAFWMLRRLVDFDVPVREIGQQFGSAVLMAAVVESFRQFLEGADLTLGNFTIVLLLVSVGAGVYFSTLLTISPGFRKTVFDNLPGPVSW